MNVTTVPEPATRAKITRGGAMKAFVYLGPGKKALEDRPKPDPFIIDTMLKHIVMAKPTVNNGSHGWISRHIGESHSRLR